jgi:polysaccharide biosynthesis transport protein
VDDYWARLFRRWPLALALVALGAIVSVAWASRAEPVYESDAQLFFSAEAPKKGTDSGFEGGTYVQQRMKSYAELVDSSAVLSPVVKQLGLAMTTSELAGHVSAQNPASTVVLDVQARSTASAAEATRIADATAKSLTSEVQRIEGTRPIRGDVVTPASEDSAVVVEPSTSSAVILGGLLGLLAAMLIALIPGRRPRESAEPTP